MPYGDHDYVGDIQEQARKDHELNQRAGGGGSYFTDAETRCLGTGHPLHGVYINERARLDVEQDKKWP